MGQGGGWVGVGKEKRIKGSKGSMNITKIPCICVTYQKIFLKNVYNVYYQGHKGAIVYRPSSSITNKKRR